jgi:glucosamine-6-phosphate deaminase
MLTKIKSFTVDSLSVEVYPSASVLAENVAKVVQVYLRSLLERQGKARILLATGSSQIEFLNILIGLGEIDWSKITCFHLDEYLGITADHPASFRGYMREKVERRINLEKFHYIEGDAEEPFQQSDRYSKLLKSQPIDLCCLGLGENGHLGFNDPSVANFEDTYDVKLVKLDDINRQQQVKQGNFPDIDKVPQYAFTVTLPMICRAEKIICLAPETRKAKVVKQMLQGEITTKCPATILRKQPQASLFLDIDSASLL